MEDASLESRLALDAEAHDGLRAVVEEHAPDAAEVAEGGAVAAQKVTRSSEA